MWRKRGANLEHSQGRKVSVMGDISVATIVKSRPMVNKGKCHDVHEKLEYNKEIREDSGRVMLYRVREQMIGRTLNFCSVHIGK